ncbi:hypothetical protein NEIFL0001_1329 [Neisseria flavescens SK114]|nr:hypothetical protein NEIFL0001_1329 [Neisseria flavescens SK114]
MNIFFDMNNNFQWGSIAALVALIAAIMQMFNNKKSIDANLKAKSRVEWIQNVRKLSADFIRISYEYKGLMDKYIEIDNEKNILFIDKEIENDDKDKIDMKWAEFLYTYNLLLLYFQKGENIDEFNKISNNKIIQSARELRNQVKNYRYKVNGMKGNPFYEQGVKPFRDNMREYLKGEWDRAKSGK